MKDKNKKIITRILCFIICYPIIVLVLLFFLVLGREYRKEYGDVRGHISTGCLMGHKYDGYTRDMTIEELKKKIEEYRKYSDRSQATLRQVILEELNWGEKQLVGISAENNYHAEQDKKDIKQEIFCQQHILDLLDQIENEK
jgi:hypothetical protein